MNAGVNAGVHRGMKVPWRPLSANMLFNPKWQVLSAMSSTPLWGQVGGSGGEGGGEGRGEGGREGGREGGSGLCDGWVGAS